jgi:Glycosyl hydrolases family 2, sugar binding domain
VRTEQPDNSHNISSSGNEGALAPEEPGENATGLFRKTFTLTEKWVSSVKSEVQGKGKGKKEGKIEKGTDRVFMVFEGVDNCANFWLNGVYIGFSKDSCLPCEFDVTDAIASCSSSSGEHLLAVQVSTYSLNFSEPSYVFVLIILSAYNTYTALTIPSNFCVVRYFALFILPHDC